MPQTAHCGDDGSSSLYQEYMSEGRQNIEKYSSCLRLYFLKYFILSLIKKKVFFLIWRDKLCNKLQHRLRHWERLLTFCSGKGEVLQVTRIFFFIVGKNRTLSNDYYEYITYLIVVQKCSWTYMVYLKKYLYSSTIVKCSK